jgi:hypothetical protein
VDPRASSDAVEKINMLPLPGIKPDSPVIIEPQLLKKWQQLIQTNSNFISRPLERLTDGEV